MSFPAFHGTKQGRRDPAGRGRSGAASSLLTGPEPFTLVENLRSRPLTFVAACLGLLLVLAAKTVVVRGRSEPAAPPRR